MDDTATNEAVARRLVDGIMARDADAIATLYADNFTLWRNFDGKPLGRKQALQILGLFKVLTDLRYENVRLQPTATGFVQQHVLCCKTPKGDAIRAEVCLIAIVTDGKIERIDEYMDSAQVAAMLS